jgi:hypothetical protein
MPRCKICKKDLPDIAFRTMVNPVTGMQYLQRACIKCYNDINANRHKDHGLGPGEMKTFHSNNGNKCAICGSTHRLCVDHNHKAARRRGSLCFNCNVGLGAFKDSLELLEKATMYLKKYETTFVDIFADLNETVYKY